MTELVWLSWVYREPQHSHIIPPARAICCFFSSCVSLTRGSISALFLQPSKRAGRCQAGRGSVNFQPQELWVNRGQQGGVSWGERLGHSLRGRNNETQSCWSLDTPWPAAIRARPTWSPSICHASAWILASVTKGWTSHFSAGEGEENNILQCGELCLGNSCRSRLQELGEERSDGDRSIIPKTQIGWM